MTGIYKFMDMITPKFTKSWPTYQLRNLLVLLMILDWKLEVELSHSAHSIIGKSSVAIPLRRVATLRRFALQSEPEKESIRTCQCSRNSTTSCDPSCHSFYVYVYIFIKIL